MKIALVTQEYPPETARGGIGSQTEIKARGMTAFGHQVFVISRSLDSKRHEQFNDGITVIRVPGLEGRIPDMTESVQWVTNSLVMATEIEALHKRVHLDIIDFPEWAAEGFIYLLNKTEWNYIPTVIQLHGPLVMFAHTMGWPEIDSEFYRTGTHMEAKCVQLADAVYSSSECSARWIRTHYNPPDKNIPVIHMGVDTTLFAPQTVPKNKHPTVVFVGKFVANKGIHELVEACGKLHSEFPDLKLRMLGKVEEKVKLQLRGKALFYNAGDMLELPGQFERKDLPVELSKAHVFAGPSYYEGGPGFVYLEAMACGLPVVGCSGSGVEEIVKSGENGVLVSPKNVTELEQALRKILSDQKLRAQMGTKAREFVLREADSRQCLKRLEEFYFSVIQTLRMNKEVL